MKKLVLSLICGLLILNFTSGCSNKKNEETSKYAKSVTYIEDNNWNIVALTTPDENGIIKPNNNRPFYLIAVNNNEIVDAIILDSDYKATNNNEYYKISMLEFYIHCESSLNYNGKDNKYDIELLMSISDPVKFFESSNIMSTDTSNNLFGGFTSKDLFNNSLKIELENNLNEIIVEYLEENNLDFNPSNDLANYIINSLNELLRPFKGIEIVNISLNLK